MKSHQEALKSADIFASLPDELLARMAVRVQLRQFDKDARIFRAGDPGTTLFVIASGRVSIQTESATGKLVTLAELGPGDAFGDLALLDGKPRSATAIAIEDTECLTLSRQDFLDLVEADASTMRAVLASAAAVIRTMNERLIEVGSHSYAERLGRELHRLAAAHGVDTPEGILIDRPLTAQRLAALLGIWQGEIQTLLARLQYEGILVVTGDRVTIARPDRLAGN